MSNIRNINLNQIYNNDKYQSCNICSGTGYEKNIFNEIDKKELENNNVNINNLEKYKKFAPYKTCEICYGTGKKDYDVIFYYTCCLNKNGS